MLTLKKDPRKQKKAPRLHDIVCKKGVLRLSERTHVMGILNRTPDSFSDGGIFTDDDTAMRHIERMAKEGADIIDIGGESTRPGSKGVGLTEELKRVVPIIKKAQANMDVPISVDTRRSEVAEAALEAGASMVNDITALRHDAGMKHVVARHRAPVILMHMKGTPETMQARPEYDDVIAEVISYLAGSIEEAKAAGIPEEKIIVDPGIGFGKTAAHNLFIIKELKRFKVFDRPILIGTSRKSFIGGVLKSEVGDRLMGTAASVAAGILNGANMIRVHDVGEMVEVARLTDAIIKGELYGRTLA